MHHESGPGDPDPAPGRPPEILRAAHPQLPRQHRRRRPGLPRPTTRRDPCGVGRRRSRGQRGSASGAGNRGCGCDAGCSAGTCAWSREDSHIFGWLTYGSGSHFRTHSTRVRWVAGVAADSDLLTVRGRAKGVKLAATVGILEPTAELSSRHAERPANIPDRLALQPTRLLASRLASTSRLRPIRHRPPWPTALIGTPNAPAAPLLAGCTQCVDNYVERGVWNTHARRPDRRGYAHSRALRACRSADRSAGHINAAEYE